MNSTFAVINDDDFSSYDIGVPSYIYHAFSPSRESRYKVEKKESELLVFIEPKISTYSVDPETKIKLSDDIEDLYIEPHYLTITSEIGYFEPVYENGHEKENGNHYVEVSIPSSTSTPIASTNTSWKRQELRVKHENVSASKLASFKEPTPRRIVRSVENLRLLPVRLKSGEVIKISLELIQELRTKLNRQKCSTNDNDIAVFKIQSDNPTRVVQVPFADRLSQALSRLQGSQKQSVSPRKRLNGIQESEKNGKVRKKPLKLRAALDKSTIAWTSTTKTRPKATLLDQLNALVATHPTIAKNSAESPSSGIHTAKKNLSHPSLLVPYVIKLRSRQPSMKLMPLSDALKSISNGNQVSEYKAKVVNGTTPSSSIGRPTFHDKS